MRNWLATILLVSLYVMTTLFLAPLPNGKRLATANAQRFSAWLLKALNIRVVVRGTPTAGLVVANHVSYVDILSTLSIWPCRFITFTELRGTPGVGLIAALGQALFIHRSRPSQVRKDIARIEAELSAGVPIVFFPEGESFDGSHLHAFKTPLFECAIRSQTAVQPLCIRYIDLDGEPITLKNRHRIFYYGDMQLLPQLIGLLKIKSLTVELIFQDPISSECKTRKELADLAFQSIQRDFLAVVS
jgi:1-acyl-sn-glycerol-3-phosphate acyltransferase